MRIYFDENFSPHLVRGLREFQAARRSEDVDVFSVTDEFPRGAADEVWIPAIAAKHGVVITQDQNIHRVRAQWDLCNANKVGIFFCKPPKKGWSYWDIVRLIVRLWPEIKELASTAPRPFAFVIDYTGQRIKPLQ